MLPKIQRAISERLCNNVSHISRFCLRTLPAGKPSAAGPSLHLPLRVPRATRTHGPCVTCGLAVKLGKPRKEPQATGRGWQEEPRSHGLSARAAARRETSPWLLCRVCSQYPCPALSSAWHRGTSSAPVGAHGPEPL